MKFPLEILTYEGKKYEYDKRKVKNKYSQKIKKKMKY